MTAVLVGFAIVLLIKAMWSADAYLRREEA